MSINYEKEIPIDDEYRKDIMLEIKKMAYNSKRERETFVVFDLIKNGGHVWVMTREYAEKKIDNMKMDILQSEVIHLREKLKDIKNILNQ